MTSFVNPVKRSCRVTPDFEDEQEDDDDDDGSHGGVDADKFFVRLFQDQQGRDVGRLGTWFQVGTVEAVLRT
jgi:hypothetical protein